MKSLNEMEVKLEKLEAIEEKAGKWSTPLSQTNYRVF